jgi:hypothetical protein
MRRPFPSLAALFFLAVSALAGDPPQLARADAKRVLEAMDWKEVTVVAIRQGVDAKERPQPICATVLGLGTLNGKHQSINQTMFFDSELGWHVLDLDAKHARIWTKDGYREIAPWATW